MLSGIYCYYHIIITTIAFIIIFTIVLKGSSLIIWHCTGAVSVYLIIFQCWFSTYGHTVKNTPDPVRSPQLSFTWPGQYYSGGPYGNTRCCKFKLCSFFLFYFILFSFWHILFLSYYYCYFSFYFLFLLLFSREHRCRWSIQCNHVTPMMMCSGWVGVAILCNHWAFGHDITGWLSRVSTALKTREKKAHSVKSIAREDCLWLCATMTEVSNDDSQSEKEGRRLRVSTLRVYFANKILLCTYFLW